MQSASSLLTPSVLSTALPLRLLFVATSKNDGGIERHSVRMAAALRQRGVSIAYACLPGEIVARRCHEAGVPVHDLHTRNSGDLRAALRLAALIVSERINLVHVHSRRDYVPAVLGVASARRRMPGASPTRLILHAHMLRALGEPHRLSSQLFGRGADAVVAVSEAVRAYVAHLHCLPKDFVRVLHNGVDVDTFLQAGMPQANVLRCIQRSAWGIPAEALVIGMVGRLDAKGQMSLLGAASDLLARFPDLWFVFAGAEGRTGEQGWLQSLAAQGGFGDRLIFTGPHEDLPSLLPAFDVLAHLPSDESFGLALVEAMAAGLPIVATSIGGCREVVRDGVTGLLALPGDAAGLADSLSRLLADPALRCQFGTAGRRLAEDEFSLSSQIDRLQALYEELCPRPRLILQ